MLMENLVDGDGVDIFGVDKKTVRVEDASADWWEVWHHSFFPDSVPQAHNPW